MEILDMTGGRPVETWGTIVSGVKDSGNPDIDWRWASDRSVFHFTLAETEGWSLAAGLTAAGTVLDKTGPQHVRFTVNGKTIGEAALDTARRYDFLFPVDAALLKSAAPVVVEMDVSPSIPQQQGPAFGLLLHRIGFAQEPH